MTHVIFDLDGTLVDSLPSITAATNSVLNSQGFQERSIKEVRSFVGNGAEALLLKAFPKPYADERIEELLPLFVEHYGAVWRDCSKVYDGIAELLNHLISDGMGISVLTNKMDVFAKEYVQYFFGPGKFTAIVGNRPTLPRKPNPAGAKEILKISGADPSKVVLVGDTEIDMRTAKSAGLFAMGVTWGFRDKQTLLEAGADGLIDHPNQFWTLVLKGNSLGRF